jgi:D-alanyl-D-alanine dipeptidase
MSYRKDLRFLTTITLFFLFHTTSLSQPLKVIRKVKAYRQQVAKDTAYKMIELKTIIPNLVYDLRYGTTNNFMHQKLYSQTAASFLRINVAVALQKVAANLRTAGYGVKIFDAYRPYSVTKKMWDLIGDERYVANPAKGSGHNRGLAVDLTLINLATGEELPMGTGFDAFSDTAHHSFLQLPAPILQNRNLLRTIMESAGFRALETEWWHYSWPNDRGYDVLDLPFKKLKASKF